MALGTTSRGWATSTVLLMLALACGGKAPSTNPDGSSGDPWGTSPDSTQPTTNNSFIRQNPSGGIDKIDILFMIDNSLSMGDKQTVLGTSLGHLLRRLTNPDCVDPEGVSPSQVLADPAAACPAGLTREFAPVNDIHMGIVTSSLGAFGGDTCPTDGAQNAAQNDHAWLLGALPRTNGAFDAPFLAWTAADGQNYAYQFNAKSVDLRYAVESATEIGCGNEMVLESWYRFLIDPKPPIDVTTQNSAANQRIGVDNTILDLRQAFLRPDSLVAVVMLSDENDCSMRDNNYGWVTMTAGSGFRMWRGSRICDSNPNDLCCYSCMFDSLAASKCKDQDSACRQSDTDARLQVATDDINVRCRQMKKRFGYDFLFPPSRYVNALTKTKLCPDQDYGDLDCDCGLAKKKGLACNPGSAVDNPLYVNLNPGVIPTGPRRTGPDAVFLAGIVGVPWQDLAKDQNGTLEYMKASELASDGNGNNHWDLFAPKLDEDYASAQLGDPLMIESFNPRAGTHPITGQSVAPPEAGRNANSINGHEWYTAQKDVQFACIFSLETQLTAGSASAIRTCDLAAECGNTPDPPTDDYQRCARRFDGCSCTLTSAGAPQRSLLDPTVSLSPLCQSAQNSYGNKQYFAKAYPGLRELQVLRGFYEAGAGDNAIVGSICPKDLTYADRESPGYGYNPAVKSLIDRLKEKLAKYCLPRKMTVQADGTIPCAMVEAIPPTAARGWCNCTANGRSELKSELAQSIREALARDRICGDSPLPSCNDYCLCQLHQLPAGSPAGDQCLNQPYAEKSISTPGFCYVDPSQGQGSPEVVAACPGSEKQIIRVVGDSNASNQYLAAPAPGLVFVACSGAGYTQ